MAIIGRNEKVIKNHIQNRLEEDIMVDRLSLKEFVDPFMGKPVKQG